MVTKPEKQHYKHPFIHGFLIVVLLASLVYFIISLFYDKADSFSTLISSLLLIIFTLLFVSTSITTNRKNKRGFFFGGLILFGYFIFNGLVSTEILTFSNNSVINFTNMKLTDVISWNEKYNLDIIQEYEYSDMIDEYHVISQDVSPGTKINAVENITIAISEGPSPYKEVVIPNMIHWDSERVLDFIKQNHLTNVSVEFVSSSELANTVIEQSKSGNLRRDEKLKLTFSYGEIWGFEEIKLKDLSGMSEFEAKFYLKQHNINYEFEDVFSSKVKKGYVVKQSIKPGTMINTDDEKVVVSISKGPEIKVPDLKKMSMTEITEWVIKNKLKLEFTDDYDDTISENSIIGSNYDEGDTIEEGTVVEVIISRGKLTMPKFNSYSEFRDWAEKYDVKYEEKREFSNSVKAGEAIKYSYKTGDTIRNNDPVVVTVSDGKETSVPSVVGLTKDAAASKLKNAGFGYGFVYSYSSTVSKGKVIRQSISAGSKVAEGTTITVTISNGKKPSSSSSSSSGSSSSSSSKPKCTSTATHTLIIQPNWVQGGSASTTIATLKAKLAANYPKVTFKFSTKAGNDPSGYIHADSPITNRSTIQDCKTYTIIINQ